MQACQEGEAALAAAEVAHAAAAPEREEFARAEQAQVARADHDELARLTLEVQQQEKALAELGPELGKLEEQTQQSALTEQQLLAEKIAAERDLTISVIAHAGDGNTHPLIVFDPADTDMARRAEIAFGEIMDLAVSLGGTITGEHGVGRLKKPWLAGYLGPEAMELNRRIKAALDPAGILNPGTGL